MPAQAGYVEVFEGPTYDPDTQTGFNSGRMPVTPGSCVNDAGTVVGYAFKYDTGNSLGPRAARWGAGGTAAVELGNLGYGGFAYTEVYAYAMNDANTTVGRAQKYVGGYSKGNRAVRWDGGSTAATELGNLGTNSDEYTTARASAVNDANTAVGYARKYDAGSWLGHRAVRWDAGSTVATELGNLGTDGSGYTDAVAYAVNDADTVVGYAMKYDISGRFLGNRAVMWASDGVAVDLNTLIDPDSRWTLTKACAISEYNFWIGGEGLYDPDGTGPLDAYDRLWLMQVPEPATGMSVTLGAVALLRRKRRA
jgi:hypothetical protein